MKTKTFLILLGLVGLLLGGVVYMHRPLTGAARRAPELHGWR